MDKFDDTYRIESHRLKGYDYSGDGIYFITLVICGRDCILGNIHEHKMKLSEFGKLVKKEWLKSFKIRKELFLDEFVIMPNHLHGLVVIRSEINDETIVEIPWQNVKTHGRASLHWQTKAIPIEFVRKPKSLSSFISGFKSATTNAIDDWIDEMKLDIPKYNADNKLWQTNYHDRIVRNEIEYWRIKRYVKMNPRNWESDDLSI